MSAFLLLLAFLLGVFMAPIVRPLFRPLLVELVRAILLAADEAKRVSSKLREDIEDATAEARAREKTERPAAAAPPPPPSAATSPTAESGARAL